MATNSTVSLLSRMKRNREIYGLLFTLFLVLTFLSADNMRETTVFSISYSALIILFAIVASMLLLLTIFITKVCNDINMQYRESRDDDVSPERWSGISPIELMILRLVGLHRNGDWFLIKSAQGQYRAYLDRDA